MSKRNSDGDVLTNRLSLGLARHQRLLASWIGPAEPAATPPTPQGATDDDDVTANVFGHDRHVAPATLAHRP